MTLSTIASPLPGMIYLRPSPDEAPFKAEGDAVDIGDTLVLVEVMKSFMAVEADTAGTFKGYQIENEAPVEAGDAICTIES
jgi:biotin carboxyl carrier protein